MSREKELLKNTIILSLGKFLPKMMSIITLPIITAKLTKSEYGIYDLITTLIMLLLPIATLQVQSAAFRFLIDCRNDKKKCSQIITNIFVLTIPISLIVSGGLIVYYAYKLSILVGILIGIYFMLDILYTTVSQIARGLSMNKIYSISSIILSIVDVIGIIVCVQFANQGLTGVIISLILANFVSLIFMSLYIGISKYINVSNISKDTIKEMVAYSWPMIPNNLSNWILKLSDRLVITTFLGIEANAVYAVANKIPNLLSVAQSIFTMAWQENATISVKDKDADEYYSKMFDKVFSLILGFTAILIAATPIMFKILIHEKYDEAYFQMPVLILGMFFYCMSSFQGGIYIAHKKTKSVGFTTMIAAIINLIVDFLLINYIGITAGSISTLVAYFLLYIYRMVDCLKFQNMSYNVKKQIILIGIVVIMLILCFLQNFILNIFNIFIGTIIFVLLNKYIIRDILNKVLLKNK